MTTASAVAPSTSYCSSLEMISSGVISEISGRLPAMKITEPYSPSAREKASAKPVSRPGKWRENHLDEGLPARGAERAAASSTSISISSITGCSVRTTKRQVMKVSATTMPERRVGDLETERLKIPPEPAVAGIQRGQRDAGHRRRQRERQIDQRIDKALAGERIAHQHPGDDQAEKGVDRAASSEAPKVTRKAASDRSPRAISMICPKPSSEALSTMPPSGSRISSDR
jgi:hypothetical protein